MKVQGWKQPSASAGGKEVLNNLRLENTVLRYRKLSQRKKCFEIGPSGETPRKLLWEGGEDLFLDLFGKEKWQSLGKAFKRAIWCFAIRKKKEEFRLEGENTGAGMKDRQEQWLQKRRPESRTELN